MVEQADLGSADAATAPFDVREQLIGIGDDFLVSRERVGDLLGGQLEVGLAVVRSQKVVLAITVEPDREDFGQAVDAAFARNRDVALRVEAGRRLAVMLEGAAAKRADAATMER